MHTDKFEVGITDGRLFRIKDKLSRYYPDSDSLIFTMSFGKTPFCCGLMELGAFYLRSTFKNSVELEELVTSLLEKSDFIYKNKVGLSVICALKDTGTCEFMKRIFLKTGLFRPFNGFKNKNTFNYLTLWVSNTTDDWEQENLNPKNNEVQCIVK